MSNNNSRGADEDMKNKEVVFSQGDFFYTMFGASVMTGILFIFTMM
ncbi:hypothetical protein [Paenisporosarcina cavernae]|nr:hypothetical protein [Paenisporosarcina cavernae]